MILHYCSLILLMLAWLDLLESSSKDEFAVVCFFKLLCHNIFLVYKIVSMWSM